MAALPEAPALRAYRTSAWSSPIEIVVTEPGALLGAVVVLHAEVELMGRIASRFDPTSELSALNAASGQTVEVSAGFLEVVQCALRVARATGGAVDPTVGAALCRIGYDRDIAVIKAGLAGPWPTRCPAPGWRCVEVDVERSTVRVPEGTVLDFGASAKALAADKVARRVVQVHGCGVAVSMGGDVAVQGPVPADGIAVGVADLCTGEPSLTVSVKGGGLATSSVAARRWLLGDAVAHHIVDPVTGLPVPVVWATATVAAASCVDANAASTAALVRGAEAPSWLSSLELPARLVAPNGSVRVVGDWPQEGR